MRRSRGEVRFCTNIFTLLLVYFEENRTLDPEFSEALIDPHLTMNSCVAQKKICALCVAT